MRSLKSHGVGEHDLSTHKTVLIELFKAVVLGMALNTLVEWLLVDMSMEILCCRIDLCRRPGLLSTRLPEFDLDSTWHDLAWLVHRSLTLAHTCDDERPTCRHSGQRLIRPIARVDPSVCTCDSQLRLPLDMSRISQDRGLPLHTIWAGVGSVWRYAWLSPAWAVEVANPLTFIHLQFSVNVLTANDCSPASSVTRSWFNSVLEPVPRHCNVQIRTTHLVFRFVGNLLLVSTLRL